ncbi:MAG: hypothetical protein ACQEWV_04715 [Bacillota bacterium]
MKKSIVRRTAFNGTLQECINIIYLNLSVQDMHSKFLASDEAQWITGQVIHSEEGFFRS